MSTDGLIIVLEFHFLHFICAIKCGAYTFGDALLTAANETLNKGKITTPCKLEAFKWKIVCSFLDLLKAFHQL